MSESKIDREMWLAEKDAFEAEADRREQEDQVRRQARALSRRERDLVQYVHLEDLHPIDPIEARFGVRDDR